MQISAASTTTPVVGQTVTFTDQSTNTPTSWSWSFSPATITYVGGTAASSQNPQVQFTAGGYYSVTLTVANAVGSDSEIKTNYILVVTPPVADFDADVYSPLIGQIVYFWDLSTNNPTSWNWSFSPSTITYTGGTSSTSTEPMVIFNAAGSYTVSLTASNTSGSDTETKTNFINVPSPPVANFTASTTTPNVGQTVTFTDQSTNSPTSWAWSFSPAAITYVGGTTAASQHPQVQFNTGGYYSVTLTATNFIGSDEETKTDYILATAPPVANFIASTTTPFIGQIVTFSDLSINTPTGWLWSFSPASITYEGGTSSSSQNPQVQFIAGGFYSVTLTATNAAGSDPETKTNYISVLFAPVADFSADNIDPLVGSPVNFTDLSVNNPNSWVWSFNPATITYTGGTALTSQNPQVTFNSSGLYSVTLTATNASGGDEETKTDYINAQSPILALDLTVFLEGPFNGTTMNTNLVGLTDFPLSQPYNITPWNYNGTEYVGAVPNTNVVDWVLVELRDASDAANATSATMIDRQAAFLLNSGKVVGMDGISTLQFNNSLTQQLFVVIWHRNHLGVMSSYNLIESGGTYSYDFSTGATQAFGSSSAHKQIGPGVWGMMGGDGNRDKLISNTDKSPLWEIQSGKQGYIESDYNLDNQSDNKDKDDIWEPNLGAGSQVLD